MAKKEKNNCIPRHVAIVMDGNGRWAKARFMPRLFGHKKGVESVRKVIKYCSDAGVECLTLFAFSSENWKRPEDEVSGLMSLFMGVLEKETVGMLRHNVRLQFIGDRSAFSAQLQAKIALVEQETAQCSGLKLIVAANYGGRWDILQAVRTMAGQVQCGELKPDELTEAHIGKALSTQELPEPDLFIRTGGEQRISNFLLWQLAYAELFFSEKLWPEFDEKCLQQAFDAYAGRERRFGMTGEQVKA
ncbi:MAG: Undecaprenyl diphosphate synthase (EC [uncultured Thiotrichaceae bacterium]|uniref:Ditrans,polycis-undecaprenyl-diphosphate synthase ((2E,6E)-farnesyl-diphosphate specific) n=1 Tax=uncultured Thiotrichaceae bacterium TaxID=298394 RepID=A0A6S6TTR0_9GAMM|nr:MAG: Undecaprenyl diphosphate synthase (EC [uncultured Thiotrichaceae bacterium]